MLLKRQPRLTRANEAAVDTARRFAGDADLRRHAMRAADASRMVADRVRSRRGAALGDRTTTRNIRRVARELNHVARGLDRRRRRRGRVFAGVAAGAAGGAAAWAARRRMHDEHEHRSGTGVG